MRFFLVGVVLLALSGCNAIFRALNGKPQPDTAAIDAFQNQVHCGERPGSTENVERDGVAYLRVEGCGQERDCRFVDRDERRMECFATLAMAEREEEDRERERRRISKEQGTQAAQLIMAAFTKSTGCAAPEEAKAIAISDGNYTAEVVGCEELRFCTATLKPDGAWCTWPGSVDVAKRRLELETGCSKSSIEPKKSQLLYKGDHIQTYSAFRLEGCGRTFVCTVDSERADCKVALDSAAK